MKWIIILAVSFTFWSISCNEGDKSTQEFTFSNHVSECKGIKLLELKNDDIDYLSVKIEVPQDWKVFEDLRDSVEHISSKLWCPKDVLSYEGFFGIGVSSWIYNSTLSKYFAQDEKNIVQKYNAEILDKGKYVNGENEFLWIYFKSEQPNRGEIHDLMFYTKRDSIQFVGVLISRSGVPDLHSEICSVKHIIETVRFTE